jgi:hypothetical protein
MESKLVTKNGMKVEKFINTTGHIQYREMREPSPSLSGMLQNDRHIRLLIDGKPIAVLNLLDGVNVFLSDDDIANNRESRKSELHHWLVPAINATSRVMEVGVVFI